MSGVFPHRRPPTVPAHKPGQVDCGNRREGWTCTIPKDHDGKHKATGEAGTHGATPDQEPVLHEWSGKIRGFSAMDPAKQRRIASAGGKRAHEMGVAHRWSSDEAAAAGRKGGRSVSSDRDFMSEIGKKGGAVVSSEPGHMAHIGGLGGSSNSDGPRGRAHMAKIGRKGGLSVSSGAAGREHMSKIGRRGGLAVSGSAEKTKTDE